MFIFSLIFIFNNLLKVMERVSLTEFPLTGKTSKRDNLQKGSIRSNKVSVEVKLFLM